jgi:hypothetical protein
VPNLLRLSRGHISSSCPGASRTWKRMISWPPTLESIQPVRRAVNAQKLCLPDTPHSSGAKSTENSSKSSSTESRAGRLGGGGLLNPPALFALADFQAFSGVYVALSCAGLASFAGYSAPRVHQNRGRFESLDHNFRSWFRAFVSSPNFCNPFR